jgi:hypothetical protein
VWAPGKAGIISIKKLPSLEICEASGPSMDLKVHAYEEFGLKIKIPTYEELTSFPIAFKP